MAVVLTASGASLVVPQEPAAAAEDVTAQAVAAVWRSAGTARAATAAGASDTLLAEVAAAREGAGASRSQDRTTAPAAQDGAAPTVTTDARTAAATDTASDGAAQPPATGALTGSATDPVAQATLQVQALVVQQAADDADDVQAAAAAATSSVASARAAVEAARVQREAEEAAAALAAAQADPRPLAEAMLAEHGWDAAQFRCLDQLWTKESGWRWSADNPSSSAYGIPQSLPGQKMASAGADWETNPATQIAWGLGYIADSYGTPCRAWAHSQATDWY